MNDIVLVVGNAAAQTTFIKNISTHYTQKAHHGAARTSVNVGIIALPEHTLQIIGFAQPPKDSLDQLLQQSIGCVAVVDSAALSNQELELLAQTGSACNRYGIPFTVALINAESAGSHGAQDRIIQLLGENIAVLPCTPSAEACLEVLANLLKSIAEIKSKKQLATQITHSLASYFSSSIDYTVIFDQHGFIYTCSAPKSDNTDCLAFEFISLAELCQQLAYSTLHSHTGEILIRNQQESISFIRYNDFNILVQGDNHVPNLPEMRSVIHKASLAL